jgi:hypothetical protein
VAVLHPQKSNAPLFFSTQRSFLGGARSETGRGQSVGSVALFYLSETRRPFDRHVLPLQHENPEQHVLYLQHPKRFRGDVTGKSFMRTCGG